MSLEFTELVKLGKAVAKADPKTSLTFSFNNETLSYEAMQETLRQEMNELAGDYKSYRRNQLQLFELIEEIMDEVLPKKVLDRYMDFAEVKTFAQGDRPIFKRRTGHKRAKQFITKVGLSGRYEVFKLGEESFEVKTSAIGGAAQIGLEEFLDGRVDFAELTQIVMEGMDELVQREVAGALIASVNQLPAANKVVGNGFEEAQMDRLLAIASAYGDPTIYCTLEFAVKMVPEEGWRSDRMKDERWNNGFLANYKGKRVVILPQSFEDETNAQKVIDPRYVWIIPSGVNDKPVKIAMEGETIVKEWENRDNSREVQVYKKIGVNAIMNNGICCYQDSTLTF